MKIDKELIKKVAKNTRLELTDKETEKFVEDFKDILNTFSELDEVKTENTKPSFHPVKFKESLREDKVEKCLSQEEALKNTEHKKDGYFKGPKAI